MPAALSFSLPALILAQIFMYSVFFSPSLNLGKTSRHQTDLRQQSGAVSGRCAAHRQHRMHWLQQTSAATAARLGRWRLQNAGSSKAAARCARRQPQGNSVDSASGRGATAPTCIGARMARRCRARTLHPKPHTTTSSLTSSRRRSRPWAGRCCRGRPPGGTAAAACPTRPPAGGSQGGASPQAAELHRFMSRSRAHLSSARNCAAPEYAPWAPTGGGSQTHMCCRRGWTHGRRKQVTHRHLLPAGVLLLRDGAQVEVLVRRRPLGGWLGRRLWRWLGSRLGRWLGLGGRDGTLQHQMRSTMSTQRGRTVLREHQHQACDYGALLLETVLRLGSRRVLQRVAPQQ